MSTRSVAARPSRKNHAEMQRAGVETQAFRHGGGERQEPADPLGQSGSVHLDFAELALRDQLGEKCQESAVPARHALRVESDLPDRGTRRDLLLRVRDRRDLR